MADDRVTADIQRLVAEHHQAVYGYAYRLTASAADAEDLTQQVFLVAQEKLHQLRHAGSARKWLLTIVRSRFFRTSQRPQPIPATSLGLDLDLVPAREEKAWRVDAAGLQRAIDALSPDFRIVLAMYYFEECSYREIAEQLGLPLGTVMSRLARAKRHLRSELDGGENGDRPHLPERPSGCDAQMGTGYPPGAVFAPPQVARRSAVPTAGAGLAPGLAGKVLRAAKGPREDRSHGP
jgi:RNA polymerase sigma-70 factor (ECF subfamily)